MLQRMCNVPRAFARLPTDADSASGHLQAGSCHGCFNLAGTAWCNLFLIINLAEEVAVHICSMSVAI